MFTSLFHVPSRARLSVLGDERAVEQVLVNLAINARDAMPDGGQLRFETEQVVIDEAYCRAHPWARPGRYALLSVSDTGTGMPNDVADRIFEPFFTTKGDQGSGLGLAVVHGIVEQHRGLLHCYSELGVGTTFKVYLPLFERAAQDVGPKLDGPLPRGTERVLVADDDEVVRRLTVRILSNAGYEVVEVSDGVEAVAMVREQPFDLVVLDAIMPRMDGLDAFEAIRDLHPRMPFLVISGYGPRAWPPEITGSERVAALAKPTAGEHLLRAARAVLDEQVP